MTRPRLYILLWLMLITAAVGAAAQPSSARADTSLGAFWTRFRQAVERGDQKAVASMSRFPLSMPYGMKRVRNAKDLSRRFGDVFHPETITCFPEATPLPEGKGRWVVVCGDAFAFNFEKTRNGYRFVGHDNYNE